jgi:hypothetical protein
VPPWAFDVSRYEDAPAPKGKKPKG